MRAVAGLLLFAIAGTAHSQTPIQAAAWQPTAPYVVMGQDEPGYRNWYIASPAHPAAVNRFNDYLTAWGVGAIVPTWQLLRTASDWYKCGAPPFEVPPSEDWPNVVQTLRYVREQVIPAIGPVEPVSVYRNPMLNHCAGGAQESAHRYMQAVDMVPLRPITREQLIYQLCTVHARSGAPYGVGLGFYVGLRFHIDSRRFRKWGTGSGPEAAPCLSEPPTLTSINANVPASADWQRQAPPPTAQPAAPANGSFPPKL